MTAIKRTGTHKSITSELSACGVKIESDSIVAAGAVINKSIPKPSVCGGIPAKIIKSCIN